MSVKKKSQLKLSYIKSSLWHTRTLPIYSKKWKDLREIILKRDEYRCYFCGIQAKKYMIIDHISGNAADNNLTNLRVVCPLCDSIRHSGLSGIMGKLKIYKTNLTQLEIVKKTIDYWKINKKIPTAKEIDHKVRCVIDISPITIATLEEEEIPVEWTIYKAFLLNIKTVIFFLSFWIELFN